VVDASVVAWLEGASLACCGSFEAPVVAQRQGYRFGFQNQEKDNEIYGAEGTSYAFKYRMHDARVGRFWSIDPLVAQYPHNSPYAFSENRVLDSYELEGLESFSIHLNSSDNTLRINLINAEDALSFTWANNSIKTGKPIKTDPFRIEQISNFAAKVVVTTRFKNIFFGHDETSYTYGNPEHHRDGLTGKTEIVKPIKGPYDIVMGGYIQGAGNSDKETIEGMQRGIEVDNYDRIDVYVKPELRNDVISEMGSWGDDVDTDKIRWLDKPMEANSNLEIHWVKEVKSVDEIE